MDAAIDEHLLEIGKVVRAHGLRGKIKVKTHSGDRGGLASVDSIYLEKKGLEAGFPSSFGGEDFLRFHVISAQDSRGGAILTLTGIETIKEAEGLVGRGVYLAKEDLPLPDEDEFYCFELEGFRVEDKDGNMLGTISRVLPSPAHDILEIKTPSGERLVPFIKTFVPEVRMDEKIIVLTPVKGLIDDEI